MKNLRPGIMDLMEYIYMPWKGKTLGSLKHSLGMPDPEEEALEDMRRVIWETLREEMLEKYKQRY